MSELMVIAVPPEDAWPREEDGLYRVYLGDCVLPGFVLGTYATEKEADEAANYYATHYRLKSHTIDGPWRKRAMFRLVQGGLSVSQNGKEP